ncbi:DUF4129 domain-containing protein [Synechococcus sp. RC10A2]|uniref:DUF4129 domain-containing protein n=1 Tax=Synechococcus sp. RC10A2 TaxID=2964529 RepID=UPI0039C6FB74
MRRYSGARQACSLLWAALLCACVWASEPADALLEAERALEAASRARPADRKVFVQRAQRALASLPQEAREPLEALLDEAATDGDLSDIARARRSIRAYRESLAPSPTPSPAPDRVKQQLDAIFAEPDMQIPPKSLIERLSEAFLNAVEMFVRWLNRLFGGLGGFGGGGLGQFLQWFVIVLLVLTLALAVSYIAGRVQFRRRARVSLKALDVLPDDARSLGAREWRELARRLADEGNWQLAARAYYLGILRLLHEAKLLDYDPALTNWEHLQRLRQPPLAALLPSPTPLPDPALREEAYQQLRPITLLFDSIWYGGMTPDEATYRQFEAAFESLYGRLEARAVPA